MLKEEVFVLLSKDVVKAGAVKFISCKAWRSWLPRCGGAVE